MGYNCVISKASNIVDFLIYYNKYLSGLPEYSYSVDIADSVTVTTFELGDRKPYIVIIK